MTMKRVRWPSAARVIQAWPEWPWLSCQGWKWSLVQTASKPACSAATPSSISSGAGNCSCASTKPTRRDGRPSVIGGCAVVPQLAGQAPVDALVAVGHGGGGEAALGCGPAAGTVDLAD